LDAWGDPGFPEGCVGPDAKGRTGTG
jgi:hypothetical protein